MNDAVGLDRTMSQWVSLGVIQEACITRPETCSAAGGAVTLWTRVQLCDASFSGIISSLIKSSSTSFAILCYDGQLG